MELNSACAIFSCIVLSVVVYSLGCEDLNCIGSNGTVCNDQGVCECGVCKCRGSYSGPTCEECPTCPSPCDIYKNCVGCRIFGTGPLGTMECIIQCDYVATYLPVDKFDFDNPDADDDGTTLCTNLNEAYCMESFRIGGMREGYRDLFVRTEEDCDAKYIHTAPPVIEVTMEITEATHPPQKPKDKGNKKPEDVSAVSGSNQGQTFDGNGVEERTLSSILLVTVTVLCFVL